MLRSLLTCLAIVKAFCTATVFGYLPSFSFPRLLRRIISDRYIDWPQFRWQPLHSQSAQVICTCTPSAPVLRMCTPGAFVLRTRSHVHLSPRTHPGNLCSILVEFELALCLVHLPAAPAAPGFQSHTKQIYFLFTAVAVLVLYGLTPPTTTMTRTTATVRVWWDT